MRADDGKCDAEIRSTTEIAKETFQELQNILKDREMKMEKKVKIGQCYIHPVLTYRGECWNTAKKLADKSASSRNGVSKKDEESIEDRACGQ